MHAGTQTAARPHAIDHLPHASVTRNHVSPHGPGVQAHPEWNGPPAGPGRLPQQALPLPGPSCSAQVFTAAQVTGPGTHGPGTRVIGTGARSTGA